jgi:squalene-hopene/tetraprenyl-beta-curcumene cyclase
MSIFHRVVLRTPIEPRHSTWHTVAVLVVLATPVFASLSSGSQAAAAPPPKKQVGSDPQQLASVVQRGADFLVRHGQANDGSFSSFAGCGVTALATTALLRSGRTADDPAVAKALNYLEEYTQESGGIHMPGGRIPTYETCIAVLCFQEAHRPDRYGKIIKDAEAFLRRGQWDETRGRDKSDLYYGGAGYGGKSRPDMSNTAYLLDALKSCGAGSKDPAIQKALVFVSRCQNLESEHNSTPFAAKVNDGGFYYTCVLGRQEEERQTPAGGLRSYGSMTYSGLKSMVYAGLAKDDPRWKAAVDWIRKNYDLRNNPGMGTAGLYYYYHTFAKAMDVLGEDRVEDARGVKHDWRKELVEELASRQQPNGSWVNTNAQWMEGDPNLATSFALLALSYCRPDSHRELNRTPREQ